MVMIGKVQLCNVVTFVDDTLRDNEKGLITIWIELLEKGTIKEAIEDRAKDGLIEVKSSRSRDLAFKSNESIQVQLEGQIRVVGAPLTEKYVLTYLQSASNHIVVPLEIKRDEHSPPHAAFMFREMHAGHGMPFHTVCMPVRDLTELPSGLFALIFHILFPIATFNSYHFLIGCLKMSEKIKSKSITGWSTALVESELKTDDSTGLIPLYQVRGHILTVV